MYGDDAKPDRTPLPRWKVIGVGVAGVASVFGLVGLVLKALAMVRDGLGIETYRTFFLVEFSWVGVLVFIGVAVVALLIGALVRWREQLQWRALERKYGVRDDRA